MKRVAYGLGGLVLLFVSAICAQADIVPKSDSFDVSHDYFTSGDVTGTIWDGVAYLATATAIDGNTTNAGTLTMNAPNGNGWTGGSAPSALLYLNAGTEDFDARVRVPSLWTGEWSAGHLVAQRDDASLNYVIVNDFQFGAAWGGNNFISVVNDVSSVAVTKAGTVGDPYLRLVRVGNLFTGYTSTDGVKWVEHTSATMTGSFRVGLSYGSFTAGSSTGCQFDDFSIGAPVPEPSSALIALIGAAGLLAYAWKKRR